LNSESDDHRGVIKGAATIRYGLAICTDKITPIVPELAARCMEHSFIVHGASIGVVEAPSHRYGFTFSQVLSTEYHRISMRILYTPAVPVDGWSDDVAIVVH
jgi:hypothetical protein